MQHGVKKNRIYMAALLLTVMCSRSFIFTGVKLTWTVANTTSTVEGFIFTVSLFANSIYLFSFNLNVFFSQSMPMELHAVHYNSHYGSQIGALRQYDGVTILVYLFQVLKIYISFILNVYITYFIT